jgi:hypothetical protein
MKNNQRMDQYARIKQTLFPIVLQLSLRQKGLYLPNEYPSLNLFLELGPDKHDVGGRLQLHFYRVTELKLQPLSTPFRCSPLEIHDIRDHQWEMINYRVVEDEDLSLSFYCHDFQATLVDD